MKRKVLLAIIGLVLLPVLAWTQKPPSATATTTGGIFNETEDIT